MPNKKQYHGTDMNGYQLTGLPTPTIEDTSDAATVQFVLDNAGGAPLATNVQFTPDANTFPEGTDNVDEALKQLFTYANNGKTSIANAIGSPQATSSDTFSDLATDITTAKTALDTFIDSAEGTTTGNETLAQLTTKLNDVRVFKQNTKLRQQANTTYPITLNKSVPANKLCFTVNRLVNDNATTEFTSTFDGTDASSFSYNTNAVEFANGAMRLREVTVQNSTPTTTNVASGIIYSWTINLNLYDVSPSFLIQDSQITNVSGSVLTYKVLPKEQFITTQIGATPFIDVSDTSSLEGADISGYEFLSGKVRTVFLVEGDTHWKAINDYETLTWVNVTPAISPLASDVITNGMDKYLGSYFGYSQFEQLLGSRTKIAVGFALYRENFSSVADLESFSLTGRAVGNFIPIPATANQPYTMTYNEANKQMTFTFSQEDTYQINWIDT